MSTVQEALNKSNPTDMHNQCNRISFGDVIAGLIPKRVARADLDSAASHVEPDAGEILHVETAAGAQLKVVTKPDAVVGAGEVRVVYDSEGKATLTFQAAVTGYTVVRRSLPKNLGVILSSDSGAAY